jgi:hypothetical protein
MLNSEVSRSPFHIKHNTLPENHLGQWLTDEFKLECRIKPAFDNNIIMFEVCPTFLVYDAESKLELYRFQTDTVFSFSGSHSKSYIRGVIYYLTCLSIDEFNDALKKTKSLFAISRNFEKPTAEEIEPYVNDALKNDLAEKHGIVPYWKNIPNKTVKENDLLISSLPPIPSSKLFIDNVTTEERIAISHCLTNNPPDEKHLSTIKSTIDFYKKSFTHLKQIDLRSLTDNQHEKLLDYLNFVLNTSPIINNDVTAEYIYRVTIVRDNFLENGKLRDTKFLSYPPLDIVIKNGVYNRANSSATTLFYASLMPQVAIRETHPSEGYRIVLSTWQNKSQKPLKAYPICLTGGIHNEYADRNNYAFEEICKTLHPTIAEWMECFFSFFSSEFIKESEPTSPKRYDYLFSAFFSDRLLQPFPENSNMSSFECIVYPSVAWNHIPDNLAIIPEVIKKNIYSLIDAKEYVVLSTWYDKKIDLNQYPAGLKLIRQSVAIENNRIRWNDDC